MLSVARPLSCVMAWLNFLKSGVQQDLGFCFSQGGEDHKTRHIDPHVNVNELCCSCLSPAKGDRIIASLLIFYNRNMLAGPLGKSSAGKW